MKTIIGNWKMNVGVRESVALARGTLLALRGRKMVPDVVVCPSFVALSEAHKVVARSSVALGAQNVFWEDQGAYTGEISPRMLTELGVVYVIVGHSERREHLAETDEMVGKKIARALEHGLTPVLCIGETKEQRDAGQQRDRLRDELVSALKGVHLKHRDRLFVAYEPIWAIGTGQTPEVADVKATHGFIREMLTEIFSSTDSKAIQILYGGSVDGDNAYAFLREDEVDGVLVGGASVKLNQFKDIIAAASEVLEAQTISL